MSSETNNDSLNDGRNISLGAHTSVTLQNIGVGFAFSIRVILRVAETERGHNQLQCSGCNNKLLPTAVEN